MGEMAVNTSLFCGIPGTRYEEDIRRTMAWPLDESGVEMS